MDICISYFVLTGERGVGIDDAIETTWPAAVISSRRKREALRRLSPSEPLDDARSGRRAFDPSIDGIPAMKAIMNGRGAAVKTEQVKLEAMENGTAP